MNKLINIYMQITTEIITLKCLNPLIIPISSLSTNLFTQNEYKMIYSVTCLLYVVSSLCTACVCMFVCVSVCR